MCVWGWVDGSMDGHKAGWMIRRMDEWMDGWMDELTDRQMDGGRGLDVWMAGGWMGGLIDGWLAR